MEFNFAFDKNHIRPQGVLQDANFGQNWFPAADNANWFCFSDIISVLYKGNRLIGFLFHKLLI